MSTNATTQTQTESTGTEPQIDEVDSRETNNTENEINSRETPAKGTDVYDINAQTQMEFGENGELKPKEDAIEVTLDQFDFEIDHRETETRIDRPEASGLMADDRPEVTKQDGGEQANLFADAEEDQQTLTGNSAQNQCLFDAVDSE